MTKATAQLEMDNSLRVDPWSNLTLSDLGGRLIE